MNTPDLSGKTIGNLTLTGRLGVGGMGTVYRGEHMSLGTPYAVKILHPQFSMDKTTAERFRREAVTCSKLRHPNVVFVTDFGFQEDLGIYIIMEYIEGASLRHVLKSEGPQPIGRVGRIGEQVCDALDAAHRMGIVHRDLKPDNIMILSDASQPDFTKVLDFGIAQIKDDGDGDAEKLTRAGLVLGTPAYISPEQINKKAAAVGPGADIYATGIMFYQMLTGYVPFTGQSEFEILSQHVFKIPNPVSEHRADLEGTALENLIMRMLEKDPAKRPETMGTVRRELLDAVRELRDRGYQDAFYGANDRASTSSQSAFEVSDSGMFALNTPTPMGITNIIQQLTAKSPESKVSTLITALKGMAGLHDEVFYLALWGVIQRDWLDAPLASEEFKQSNEQIKMVLKLLLGKEQQTALNDTQVKIFRGLGDLFTLGDRERQRLLVVALQSQLHHPLFPSDLLPQWAQAKGSGTWSAFKAVMTTEIRLPFGAQPLTAKGTPAAEPEPVEEVPVAEPAVVESDDKGLGYKLRQDVSLKSLKNVFSHDLFGKKKKKK